MLQNKKEEKKNICKNAVAVNDGHYGTQQF